MRAVLWTAYGGPEVLVPGELPVPHPRAGEVLVRVAATTATAGDCEMRAMRLPALIRLPMRLYAGARRPRRLRVLGQEFSGVVEETGSGVTRFRRGDAVFGSTGMRLGAYAEYLCLPVDSDEGVLVPKPEGLRFEEAAALPVGGLEAMHFLEASGLRAGQRLLVNGAGGSIGTVAVQLARHRGLNVTAVDREDKLAMLRALGAEQVVDYAREDFTAAGRRYDAVLDMVGGRTFTRCMRVLKPGGRYLMANPSLPAMLQGAFSNFVSRRRVVFGAGSQRMDHLRALCDLIKQGALCVIIDRHYPLDEAAEAHRYVEEGAKRGNVVLTVWSPPGGTHDGPELGGRIVRSGS